MSDEWLDVEIHPPLRVRATKQIGTLFVPTILLWVSGALVVILLFLTILLHLDLRVTFWVALLLSGAAAIPILWRPWGRTPRAILSMLLTHLLARPRQLVLEPVVVTLTIEETAVIPAHGPAWRKKGD